MFKFGGVRRSFAAKGAFVAMLVLASSAFALSMSKSIDRRKSTAPSPYKYFVSLCACKPWSSKTTPFGHVWVVWSIRDSKNNLMSQSAYGFNPKDGAYLANVATTLPSFGLTTVFTFVPGTIKDESQTGKVGTESERLDVQVDKSAFDSSMKLVTTWSSASYSLALNNCISFAKSVGGAIGVNTNVVGALPYDVTDNWIKQNN